MPARRLAFARAVLFDGHFQRGPAYEMCLVAVMAAENSEARWNPMDTTLAEPGATPYNSFGPGGLSHVWNYPNAETGVKATVATLLGADMREWATALRLPGATPESLCEAFSRVPWAFVGDQLPAEIVADYRARRRSYRADRRVVVPGFGPWPYRRSGAPKV